MRKDRNPDELSLKEKTFVAKPRRIQHQRRQSKPFSAIRLYVPRDYDQIGRQALPEARRLRQRLEIRVIHRARIHEAGSVCNVTESEVKVPIHALQRANDQPIFWCRNAES